MFSSFISYRIHCLRWNRLKVMLDTLLVCPIYDLNTSNEEQLLMLSSTASIHLKKNAWIHTFPHPTLRYQLLPHDVTVACAFFHFLFSTFPPLQTVDSLSNRKQMGDLCCGLLPNGANSHYNVCKLCLFSPSLTSTPCTTLPSDVFNTCFRCRRVILLCLVLLITGYLSPSAQNGKNRHHLFCGAV